MKNGNRAASTAFFVAASCFFVVAVIHFFGVNTDFMEGVVFMEFGSAFLCLGAVFLKKERSKTNEKTEKTASHS